MKLELRSLIYQTCLFLLNCVTFPEKAHIFAFQMLTSMYFTCLCSATVIASTVYRLELFLSVLLLQMVLK